jgi:phage shock protein PspC (stress-responsive transcriptional regulator)
MKKVINITLNSVVFAIEQDAYDVLDSYLEQIKTRLNESVDQLEIITDIESAIAEKLVALGRSEKIAVSIYDVEQMRTQMGTPADFGDDAVGEHSSQTTADTQLKQRQLFRDTDDAVIAGVASGIAKYFSIDPVLVRIAFVASVFLNGIGILVYLIMWLIVPAAKTTADRYAMDGKKVTVEDIAASVKKNLSQVELPDSAAAKSVWHSVRNVLQQLFAGLGALLRAGVKLLRYIVGIGFVIAGALGVAGLVSMYSVVLLSDKTFLPLEAQQAVAIMLGNALGIIAIAASFVMSLIPLLVLIVLGVSLLKKHNLFTTNKTVTLAVVWIIALVLAGTTSSLQAEKVWQEIGSDLGGEVELIISEDGMQFVVPDAVLPVEVQPVEEQVMCTMEVKECPDGSYVGRSGPTCAFAKCPVAAQ